MPTLNGASRTKVARSLLITVFVFILFTLLHKPRLVAHTPLGGSRTAHGGDSGPGVAQTPHHAGVKDIDDHSGKAAPVATKHVPDLPISNPATPQPAEPKAGTDELKPAKGMLKCPFPVLSRQSC
jgi:hypothetical protein